MSEYVSAYCKLISSPAQLEQCRAAKTLTELLQTIKTLWNIPALSDSLLLAELNRLNRCLLEDTSLQLAGVWLPYRYDAAARSIHWCLPDGHATEPFQTETISRYRSGILLNMLIQPQTSLAILPHQADAVAEVQPAGFIFHLSRCGSTLVTGCLSELDSTCVFSESPVLTGVLLDTKLDEATRQQYLRHLIDLQASAFPARPNIIIKWNAWDIFRWPMIRSIYPQIPCIFLARNPLEILASHQREAGWHMSGDPALGCVNTAFVINPAVPFSLLDFRIGVLSTLLTEMLTIGHDQCIRRLDYKQLDLAKFLEICACFDLPISQIEVARMKTRMSFNSKLPAMRFQNDSAEKQNTFGADETQRIEQMLMPLYEQFLKVL